MNFRTSSFGTPYWLNGWTGSRPTAKNSIAIEEIENANYLDSVVYTEDGTKADVKAMIGKARADLPQLKIIWKSKVLSLNNKIRIFNINVKAAPLCGARTWRTIVTTIKRIQTFASSCPRRILGVW